MLAMRDGVSGSGAAGSASADERGRKGEEEERWWERRVS